MFFICKERCMCTGTGGGKESFSNNPTVLYCFGEVKTDYDPWRYNYRRRNFFSLVLNLISYSLSEEGKVIEQELLL